MSVVESSSRPDTSSKEDDTSAQDKSDDISEEDNSINGQVTVVSTPNAGRKSIEPPTPSQPQQQHHHPPTPPSAATTTTTTTATATTTVTSAKGSLPLKTQVTLKSPLDGSNLGPFHKPEEFIDRIVNNLTSQGENRQLHTYTQRNQLKR
jgi:hypothetical protein